jgi:hypothetical protein
VRFYSVLDVPPNPALIGRRRSLTEHDPER